MSRGAVRVEYFSNDGLLFFLDIITIITVLLKIIIIIIIIIIKVSLSKCFHNKY